MSLGTDMPCPPVTPSGAGPGAGSFYRGRVRWFLLVTCLGWISFAVQNAPQGRWIASAINLVAAGSTFALWRWVRASEDDRRARIASHAALAVSSLGITGIALTSGQSESMSVWYLAAIPMFAAHLLSAGAAAAWSGIAIAAMALVHLSELFVTIPPEYTAVGTELLVARALFVLVLLGFALASWRLTARHVTALEERERTISHQARELTVARDEALEASRVKSEFLGRMSHELRTPMHGVIGMTGLLLETRLDDAQREFAETVHRSGETLLAIVDDILDFAEIEAGRIELETRRFEPVQVTREAVAFFQQRAEQKGIAVRLHVEPGVPDEVEGDRRRLRQLLMILVGNAVKFTGEGGIDVRLAPLSDAPCGLRCTVTDTGIGIDTEHRARVFEAFSQVDGSMTRRHGGTGLGLALASRLVALMGGEIGVESEPGRGSSFWFTARLGQSPAPEAAREAADSARPARAPAASEPERAAPPPMPDPAAARARDRAVHPLRRGRILVADDNDINQRVAVRMLERLGFAVDVAGDGREAVQAVQVSSYDLVLMDCQMPEMDGLAATAEIRRAENGVRHTPIVAMTANVAPGDRERCIAAGMDAFLAKPVKRDALAAVLARFVSAQDGAGSPPAGSSAA